MQPIGDRETKQLREAAQRKVEGEKSEGAAKDFHKYVRRLVKDLEMKGTIRTAVEGILLSLHADDKVVLMAECIRTFPTVTFPASLLLKREEIETLKVSGASVIAALHHGHGDKNRMYSEAPFDLMYGFRGSAENVDLLTPYEMLLHYAMERILPPTTASAQQRASWTVEGNAYRQACSKAFQKPVYKAGVHYTAREGARRILLPDLPALRGLRHGWCWETRPRPHIPTWSFAKVPQRQFSPEQNARLLCLYFRPWTLNPAESSRDNPWLSLLGKCSGSAEGLTPVWTNLPSREGSHSVQCSDSVPEPSAKKRRLIKKTGVSDEKKHRLSYAASWEKFIDGNVVSDTSRRYILNLLAATAATKTEDSGDSSDDSDDDIWHHLDLHPGSMAVVENTLRGLAARSFDEGVKALGRHARTIRLGRALWQSPALDKDVINNMRERFSDDGTFPPLAEMRKAVAAAKKPTEERPAPFAGKTQPYVHLSTVAYGQRVRKWLQAVKTEKDVPTTEQFDVLSKVADRVLVEVRLLKEGILLPKAHPLRKVAEQPLLGLCHGSPGTGKSRVITWIRRFFMEALGWKHGDEFLCVAFQNRVAYAMEGNTMNAGGDIGIGGQRSLDHTDIDVLFTRNQYLRWVLIDELPMVPDELLGTFDGQFSDAATETRFKHRVDKSVRFFGGYNMLGFGDFYQIPQIPA